MNFLNPDGLKYVAKIGAVQRPSMAVSFGANLPYFLKQGTIQVYFPRELKPGILRGYPETA